MAATSCSGHGQWSLFATTMMAETSLKRMYACNSPWGHSICRWRPLSGNRQGQLAQGRVRAVQQDPQSRGYALQFYPGCRVEPPPAQAMKGKRMGHPTVPAIARNAAAEIIPARGAMFAAQRVGRQERCFAWAQSP